MAKIDIDEKKVESLHQFLENGGEFEVGPVFLHLGIVGKKQEIFDAYTEALADKYPEIYQMQGDDQEAENEEDTPPAAPAPEPAAQAPVPAKKAAKAGPAPAAAAKSAVPPAPTKYLLRHPNGTTQELEVVQTTSKALVFEPIRQKDLVVVKIKGQDAEVDLELVRAGDQRYFNAYGIPAEKLLMLGELAKA